MSVYRVTDLVGTSTESWEDAAAAAIKVASKTIRDLRVTEVVEQDVHIDAGGQLHLPDEASGLLQVRRQVINSY